MKKKNFEKNNFFFKKPKVYVNKRFNKAKKSS